jgi:hypothetical protein
MDNKFPLAAPDQAGVLIIILQEPLLGQVGSPSWVDLDNKEEIRTTPVLKTGQSAAAE